VTIEPMRWWQIDEVRRLEERLFPDDAWSIEQFWGELAQPTRRYCVAICDDRVIGYAGLFLLPPDADVQTVGVAPEAQGRGIAGMLLGSLLAGADDEGVTHTLLEVRDGNEAALTLYARLGFVAISRRPRYYPDGTDALVMRRPRPGSTA
jgi:ribosomal-protein-alanine N-acetyltransferase